MYNSLLNESHRKIAEDMASLRKNIYSDLIAHKNFPKLNPFPDYLTQVASLDRLLGKARIYLDADIQTFYGPSLSSILEIYDSVKGPAGSVKVIDGVFVGSLDPQFFAEEIAFSVPNYYASEFTLYKAWLNSGIIYVIEK